MRIKQHKIFFEHLFTTNPLEALSSCETTNLIGKQRAMAHTIFGIQATDPNISSHNSSNHVTWTRKKAREWHFFYCNTIKHAIFYCFCSLPFILSESVKVLLGQVFFFTKQYVRSEGSKINPRQRDTFLEVCVIGKMIACYYIAIYNRRNMLDCNENKEKVYM